MGCLSSKPDKNKELSSSRNQNAHSKEHPDEKEFPKQDKEDNATSKYTVDNKNENHKIQQNDIPSNQINSQQNNVLPINNHPINDSSPEKNGQENSLGQKSQTEVIKVSAQKEKKLEVVQGNGNKAIEKKNVKNGGNAERNDQQKIKQRNLNNANQQDIEECNVDDIDEGVQASMINIGECARGVKLLQNNSVQNKQSPSKFSKSDQQQQQSAIPNTNNNASNANNNINNNNNEIQMGSIQQEQQQPQKSTLQYRPLEIMKLDEEQEQKAMEQYEKLIQNQQIKSGSQAQYQAVDEKLLVNMIQEAITNLNWKQALHLNTSLLRIKLQGMKKTSDGISKEVKSILLQQIDLLQRDGQYQEAVNYASNYLEEESQEYASYVCSNYLYMNSKYEEAFMKINECIQQCIVKNIRIRAEYIISACNCMIEGCENKITQQYLDQLPIKTCSQLNTSDNLNAIAESYMRIKKYDTAKDILKTLINNSKDNYDAHVNLGLIHMFDDVKKAKTYFTKALDILSNQKSTQDNHNNNNINNINSLFLQNMISN